jgi:hypothetical protein
MPCLFFLSHIFQPLEEPSEYQSKLINLLLILNATFKSHKFIVNEEYEKRLTIFKQRLHVSNETIILHASTKFHSLTQKKCSRKR